MATTREYSHHTIVAYRSRLKILLAALEAGLVPEDDLNLAVQEVKSLQEKLGPNTEPANKQGRPRKYIKLTMAEVEALKAGKEIDKLAPAYWSKEAIEMRKKVKDMQLTKGEEILTDMQKIVDQENALKEAAEQDKLVQQANEQLGGGNEGSKQATDAVEPSATDTK